MNKPKTPAEIGIAAGFANCDPKTEEFLRKTRLLIASMDADILLVEALKASLEKNRQILRELRGLSIRGDS